MDYFQGVVAEYLRADRSRFVNTEYLIQIEEGDKIAKGQHWYCDLVAIDFGMKAVYLCEVSYSRTMHSLDKRLQAWAAHWPGVRNAVLRDSNLKDLVDFELVPWLFVPKKYEGTHVARLLKIACVDPAELQMPTPRVTYLEDILPWLYRSWNGKAYEQTAGEGVVVAADSGSAKPPVAP